MSKLEEAKAAIVQFLVEDAARGGGNAFHHGRYLYRERGMLLTSHLPHRSWDAGRRDVVAHARTFNRAAEALVEEGAITKRHGCGPDYVPYYVLADKKDSTVESSNDGRTDRRRENA